MWIIELGLMDLAQQGRSIRIPSRLKLPEQMDAGFPPSPAAIVPVEILDIDFFDDNKVILLVRIPAHDLQKGRGVSTFS